MKLPYKSNIFKKPFIRQRRDGGVQIVRDGYGGLDWYATTKAVNERDGGKCLQCGSTEKVQTHHAVPLSRGGMTKMSNLISLCEKCHEKRHRHLRR